MDIIAFREEHGLTQKDLALSLGVSESAVCRWEGENRAPKRSVLLALEQLSVKPDQLLRAPIKVKKGRPPIRMGPLRNPKISELLKSTMCRTIPALSEEDMSYIGLILDGQSERTAAKAYGKAHDQQRCYRLFVSILTQALLESVT